MHSVAKYCVLRNFFFLRHPRQTYHLISSTAHPSYVTVVMCAARKKGVDYGVDVEDAADEEDVEDAATAVNASVQCGAGTWPPRACEVYEVCAV